MGKNRNGFMDPNRVREIVLEVLSPMDQWAQRCHEASVALVLSKRIVGLRVARGGCLGVGSQHSWCTVGNQYNKDAIVIDTTLWSYKRGTPKVHITNDTGRTRWPKGFGNLYEWGRPPPVAASEAYTLKPLKPWSIIAQVFLDELGPIDLNGWRMMAGAPVLGWPAEEIMAAMNADEKIAAFISIDIKGMLLDCVPDLYPRS